MARIKKQSKILELAQQRLAALKTFQYKPTFGPMLTEAIYEKKINSMAAQIDDYNQLLAELDQKLNDIKREEAELKELNQRFLSASAAQYGPDSSEYEMLGGTRTSERKRRR